MAPSNSDFSPILRRILQLRSFALVVVAAGAAILAIVGMSAKSGALAVIAAVAIVPSLTNRGLPERAIRVALYVDILLAIALWWLYGPLANIDFVLFYVVAVGGLLLPAVLARPIIGAAVLAEIVQVPLHFAGEHAMLPGFHPVTQIDMVPTELLTPVGLRIALIIATGTLFMRIASQLRSSNEQVFDHLRTKNEFIASVSHELRTPLAMVVGASETLSDRDSHLSPEERSELTGMVSTHGWKMAELIEDLLVAAWVDAESLVVLPESIDLRAIVTDLAERPTDDDSASQVEVAEGDATAWADPVRTRQIIRNLLTNAHRHGGDHIEVSFASGTHHRDVIVTDNGPGIPEAKAQAAFDPFQRTEGTLGKPGTLGVGLTVARHLADRMGGSLTYSRADGKSRFRLSLPTPPGA
jgi:signal transduction histidine kinase